MSSQNQEPHFLPTGTTLYRFNGVPVVAQPDFWPAPILRPGLLAWIAGLHKPERSWLQRLGQGLLAMPWLLIPSAKFCEHQNCAARVCDPPSTELAG